jgi:hypothetical protein
MRALTVEGRSFNDNRLARAFGQRLATDYQRVVSVVEKGPVDLTGEQQVLSIHWIVPQEVP